MKRLYRSLVLVFLAVVLVACGSNESNSDVSADGTFDNQSLYLITDVGTIDDRSFNQGSWEGLSQYAKEIGVTPKYIVPAGESHQDYFAAISQAVTAGAKVVVTPGFYFETAVHEAQSTYPDVKFILIDGEPRAEGVDQPADYSANTVGVNYSEEQAGFLAGYAAVKDGFTNLGFMGGRQVNAVVRFGYGFVQGADVAAEELGKDIDIRYTYLNGFTPEPQYTTLANSWYADGVQVIFTSAGGAGNSVMAAAQTQTDKWVIGVDVDQKEESPTVITSSMKNLKGSVYEIVKSIGEGTFAGGQMLHLDITEDMVQISDDLSRFRTFTLDDYNKIKQTLKDDIDGIRSNIPSEKTVTSVKDIDVKKTTLQVVE